MKLPGRVHFQIIFVLLDRNKSIYFESARLKSQHVLPRSQSHSKFLTPTTWKRLIGHARIYWRKLHACYDLLAIAVQILTCCFQMCCVTRISGLGGPLQAQDTHMMRVIMHVVQLQLYAQKYERKIEQNKFRGTRYLE